MSESEAERLEDQIYELRAKLYHYRSIAVSFLGPQKVAQIEKNSELQVKKVKAMLQQDPIHTAS